MTYDLVGRRLRLAHCVDDVKITLNVLSNMRYLTSTEDFSNALEGGVMVAALEHIKRDIVNFQHSPSSF